MTGKTTQGARWTVPATAAVVPACRMRVVAQLLFWGHYLDTETTGTLRLLVTELVTNALEHSGDPQFELSVAVRPGEVYVAVTDTSPGEPAIHHAGAQEESGRGMFLVSVMAKDYGIERRPLGKETWLTLRLPPRPRPAVQHQPAPAGPHSAFPPRIYAVA